MAHRQALPPQHRQVMSQRRLESAVWFLVFWSVQVHRLSHPAAAPTTTAQASEKQPTALPGSAYSWRKPFLRRPPSAAAATAELCAKN